MFNILSASLFTATRMSPPRHPLNLKHRDQARETARQLAFGHGVWGTKR